MMLTVVKVLVAHSNGYGDTFSKDKGSSYALPADMAATLADEGLVELPGGDDQAEAETGDEPASGSASAAD